MKKLWIIGLLVFLFGCSERDFGMERGLAFRQRLMECNGCSFDAAITADFGDKTYSFQLSCQGNSDGSLAFTVEKPDTISGISGVLAAKGGQITFEEDRCVAFPMLAEGEISPIGGPWVLYNTLRSGYILACGMEEDQLRMTLNDTYEEEAFQVDVWLDGEDRPAVAEILWKGRRVLTIQVTNFQIL